MRLLAPILSFTTEEVWGHLNREGSVHRRTFPEPAELTAGMCRRARQVENWTRLIALREDVLKSLEAARKEKFIGAPLEASLRLSADGELYPLLRNTRESCPGLFIVSEVALASGRRRHR